MSSQKFVIAIWSVVILAAIAFIALAVSFGARPKAARLIDPSGFAGPESLGSALYDRMAPFLETESVLVFGGDPNRPSDFVVAQAFLARAKSIGRPFYELMIQTALSAEPNWQLIDINEQTSLLARKIDALTKQKIFIYVPSIYSSHLIADNPIQRLEQALGGRRLVAVSLMKWALNSMEAKELNPGCSGLERDRAGTAGLACTALARAQNLKRKKINPQRWLLALTQEGDHDYLALIREPSPK